MRKANLDDTVSLFSFLDIMASLIGILVLLITAATLAQIGQTVEDPSDLEAVKKSRARAAQYRVLRQRVKTDTDQQQRLAELVQQAETLRQQVEQQQAEIAQREARRKALDEQTQKQPPLEAEAKQLQEMIDAAQPKLDEAKQRLIELRTLLANRKESGQSEIQILPSGSGYDRQPTFVECAANEVVLHDGPEPVRIPIGRVATSEAFSKLLESVKQQPKGTLVFLVRPDGTRTYQTASGVARRAYVTNGKLAVAGHGKLDLSMFQDRK